MATPNGKIKFSDVKALMPGTFTNFGLSTMRKFNLKTPQSGIIKISNISNQYPFPTINAPVSSIMACYSVRLVNANYTGPIFQLIRSSDNALQTFYSDNKQSYLTTGANNTGTTYATWIGANTAYVTIWYDQSGNNYNASNNYTNATRPYIAIENGKYLPYYTSINCNILQTTTGFQPNTIFCNWCNINGNYGSIVASQYDYEQRFYTTLSVNGGLNSSDWFYSATGTKLSYNLGVSATTINLNSWNCMSLSAQTPSWNTFSPAAAFTKIGTDGITTATSTANRGITGKMAEIFFHNKIVVASDIIAYYNNRLF